MLFSVVALLCAFMMDILSNGLFCIGFPEILLLFLLCVCMEGDFNNLGSDGIGANVGHDC